MRSAIYMSKTGWFTVRANGKQQLGLISFVPNRVYHLHKSVPFNEIGRKSLKLVWPRRNGTRITVWNIPSGKTVRLFLVFRCSLKVSAGKTPKRCVSFTFQPDFPETFCKWQTTTESTEFDNNQV